MKKTLALTTMTALALVKTAAAENRIQYNMEDAAAAANKDANTFSWTFSGKTSRAAGTADASTPVASAPVSNWNADGTNKITGTMYDQDGYDKDGYDQNGFNAAGINKETGTAYNAAGYDQNGYNARGFNEDGIHKDTETEYDNDGYNVAGFNGNGEYMGDGMYGDEQYVHEYDTWNKGVGWVHHADVSYPWRGVYDDEGYDAFGYNRDGYDRDGNYACDDESFCGTHDCDGDNYAETTIDGVANCWQCYTADTPITLADGRVKRADEITYDDELLVWNFDEGKLDHAKPIWIQVPKISPNHNYMRFSDGSVLKTINQHRIFNIEAGKFTYPMTDETPVGTHTLNAKGEVVELVEKKVIEEEVTYYNLWTERHINCFAGNVLTSCRLNNIYPIKDLKFVKDDRKLVPFSAFDKLDRKWYDGLRLAEQPEAINRGNDVSFNDKSVQDYVLRSILSMKA